MATLYVLRTFGSVLILNTTPPPPVTPNTTFYVRRGDATLSVREGNAVFYNRKGDATVKVR